MDMLKMLSIEGFVEYYVQVYKVCKEYKETPRMKQTKGCVEKVHTLLHELQFVEKRYALMCPMSELQKALEVYPKGTPERMAVQTILDKKQSMLNSINEILGL